MNYLEPWYELPSTEAANLEQELDREVGPQHCLRGVGVRAIARRQDRDDVLFALTGGNGEVAEVHLTWSVESDRKWPITALYPSFTAWANTKMLDDNASF